MIKDIDISHYYKKFIETSNDDMATYAPYEFSTRLNSESTYTRSL